LERDFDEGSGFDAEGVLRERCERFRVPPGAAARLLPLVRRAAAASPRLRRKLMDLVDATLAVEAESLSRRDRESRLLLEVAALLHGWSENGPPPPR
jgi:hypothetical protein